MTTEFRAVFPFVAHPFRTTLFPGLLRDARFRKRSKIAHPGVSANHKR